MILRGGLYTSTDRGATWSQISNDKDLVNRPFYYLNLYAHPVNSGVLFSSALNFIRSNDGGKTWKKLSTPHGDNHDLWINPSDTMIWIQSNDGGANITLDAGKSWSTQFNQPTSELYTVNVDDQYPYWLYAGQQDNYSTIAVPSRPPYGVQAGANSYIINTGGCETGPAVPKPGNHNIVYSNCKGRFGVYDKRTDQEKQYYVGASNIYGHNPKDLQYRFQRVAPILVSPHNADVVYHGSQFLHKTTNDGIEWTTISPDLTAFEADKQVISGSPITRDVTGEEYYSTLYEIAESPLQEGQIWVGSNDGVVSLSMNGGTTWENVTPTGLPKGGRVDCIEPSYHKNGTAYIAVLRTLLGDDKPYLYKTSDYGKNWELLSKSNNGIPNGASVRVVREDPKKDGILYAGTESGMYISFDEGKNWTSFQQNLPVTPINDIRVFRNDLILATMGRGFWIMDDISPLHAKEELGSNQLLDIQPAIKYNYRGSSKGDTPEYPSPAVNIHYYLQAIPESIQIDIVDANGKLVNSYLDNGKGAVMESKRDMATGFYNSPGKRVLTKNKGLNTFQWDMTHFGPWSDNERRSFMNGPSVTPGTYTVEMSIGDERFSKTVNVVADPRVLTSGTTQKDMDAQIALSIQIRDLLSDANTYAKEINKELDLVRGKSKSKTLRLQAILDKLQTPDGTYMQPMLIDQIGYLASMLKQADQMPGKDAYMRYENLSKELETIKMMKR
uniref:WD40/YVTN/BNR-like repeat-containing protein n=1 Tax=Fulvivirga sp. TaxID=1931237 RepID=UPI004049BFEB